MSPTPFKYTAKDGTETYRVRFRLNGKQSSETFATESEALVFCAEVKHRGPEEAVRRRVAELEGEAVLEGPTVDDMFEEWIVRVQRRTRSDRTPADNRRDWRNWVSPKLGHIPVAALTVGDVQEWIDWMDAGDKKTGRKPLAPKSIADRHAMLHGVVQHAAWAGRRGGPVITGDTCVGTVLPRRVKGDPKGLLPAEWAVFYDALVRVYPAAADLVLFLVGTGWRWSEATALSKLQVEDDGRTVHVIMEWVMRRNAEGKTVRVQDSKTRASRRRTQLDAEVGEMVRRRVSGIVGDGLVFTTKTGAKWHSSNFRRSAWDRALKASGLTKKITPHDLRHTHAAWLLMSGQASIVDVSRRLGHSNISTTVDIYGSLVQDAPGAAVDAVAAMRRPKPALPAGEVLEGDVVPVAGIEQAGVCPRCHGDGYASGEFIDEHGDPDEWYEETCSMCEGRKS